MLQSLVSLNIFLRCDVISARECMRLCSSLVQRNYVYMQVIAVMGRCSKVNLSLLGLPNLCAKWICTLFNLILSVYAFDFILPQSLNLCFYHRFSFLVIYKILSYHSKFQRRSTSSTGLQNQCTGYSYNLAGAASTNQQWS